MGIFGAIDGQCSYFFIFFKNSTFIQDSGDAYYLREPSGNLHRGNVLIIVFLGVGAQEGGWGSDIFREETGILLKKECF